MNSFAERTPSGPWPRRLSGPGRPWRRVAAACGAALALWASSPAAALGAERLEVLASRQGDLVEVRARAEVQAPLELVWATLADYERMPEFIPGMKTSRVLARDGQKVTVAQTGEAKFLFFSTPIDIVVESTEAPPHFDVRLVSGNLRSMQGRYETALSAQNPPTVELRWTGSLGADIQVPDWVGLALMRRQIEKQFAGMVKEIERREAARRAALPPQPTP